MYECRCHTCDEEAIGETLEAAQRFLNEHAEREHEVEFVRVGTDRLRSSDGVNARE